MRHGAGASWVAGAFAPLQSSVLESVSVLGGVQIASGVGEMPPHSAMPNAESDAS